MEEWICIDADDIRRAIESGYKPPVVKQYKIELQFHLLTLPFVVKDGDFIV